MTDPQDLYNTCNPQQDSHSFYCRLNNNCRTHRDGAYDKQRKLGTVSGQQVKTCENPIIQRLWEGGFRPLLQLLEYFTQIKRYNLGS